LCHMGILGTQHTPVKGRRRRRVICLRDAKLGSARPPASRCR
jgi:hypothetical protein